MIHKVGSFISIVHNALYSSRSLYGVQNSETLEPPLALTHSENPQRMTNFVFIGTKKKLIYVAAVVIIKRKRLAL